jgi:hypothetical protein
MTMLATIPWSQARLEMCLEGAAPRLDTLMRK